MKEAPVKQVGERGKVNWEEKARQALELALRAGGAQVEVYLSSSYALEIQISQGAVESLIQAEEAGVGLRALWEGRVGFAYTTDLSTEGLSRVAAAAVEAARVADPDPYQVLPLPAPAEPLHLVDKELARRGLEEKMDLAREIEAAALRFDSRVRQVRRATYSESRYHVHILNSRGLQASYEGTTVSCDALAVAEGEGGSETGWSYQGARRYADLKPRQVGEEAAQKAVALLGAGTIPTRRLPVLLDPFVAAEFLQVLSPGLTADAVQKGKSLFRGRVGEAVASPLVQLVDHGRLENGLASAPVDDEGVPTRETVLIADGVLRGYLYNTYTAARDGVASTGNGVRNSFRGTPEVRPSNFCLRPGTMSRQRLWAESGEALYLTSVLGMHTANPISGDFSLGAAGLLLRDGEVVRPVRGVTVAGNLLELLQGIDGLADDLRFLGGYGAPTVRVRGLTVSGD